MRGIGDGTLARSGFAFYVRQDYRFVVDYAGLLALGRRALRGIEQMRRSAGLAQGVFETEMALHVGLAQRWGIGRASSRQSRRRSGARLAAVGPGAVVRCRAFGRRELGSLSGRRPRRFERRA